MSGSDSKLYSLFTDYGGIKGPVKAGAFITTGTFLVILIFCNFGNCSGITEPYSTFLQVLWIAAFFFSGYRSIG
jgi:hypothetical protein